MSGDEDDGRHEPHRRGRQLLVRRDGDSAVALVLEVPVPRGVRHGLQVGEDPRRPHHGRGAHPDPERARRRPGASAATRSRRHMSATPSDVSVTPSTATSHGCAVSASTAGATRHRTDSHDEQERPRDHPPDVDPPTRGPAPPVSDPSASSRTRRHERHGAPAADQGGRPEGQPRELHRLDVLVAPRPLPRGAARRTAPRRLFREPTASAAGRAPTRARRGQASRTSLRGVALEVPPDADSEQDSEHDHHGLHLGADVDVTTEHFHLLTLSPGRPRARLSLHQVEHRERQRDDQDDEPLPVGHRRDVSPKLARVVGRGQLGSLPALDPAQPQRARQGRLQPVGARRRSS